jgi:hypothetical protein
LQTVKRILFGKDNVSGIIAFAIVATILLGCACPKPNDSHTTGSTLSNPDTTNKNAGGFKTGQDVTVGYMQYKVYDSWYSSRLNSNPYLNTRPDAQYLFIDLGVGNLDKEERAIPPFKLVDDRGAEYGTSDKAWRAEGSIGLLDNLNPGVGKRAYVIFDVPEGGHYKLKVSGGYWSAADALIELTPNTGTKKKK